MTTKNTAATKAVRDYVVSVIDHDGSPAEKLQFFFDTFKSEYSHEIARSHQAMQKPLESYLRGLPSTINHAFANHEIIELLTDWGYIHFHTSEKAAMNELDRYWTRIAGALVFAARAEGVEV